VKLIADFCTFGTMMKILSAAQIKALDAATIHDEPVASIDLMERACRAFAEWFTTRMQPDQRIGIVCGTGNNGGDGLGIARMLHDWNYPVHVWIVRGLVPESPDFKINLQRLREVPVDEIVTESDQGLFGSCDVLIDAVFGTGLSRPPEGIYAQVIRCINATKAIRVSVDIPSGLMADQPSSGDIVQAHHTVTFQLPKLAFLLPQNFQYTGEWHVARIGLREAFIQEAPTPYYLLTKRDIRPMKKARTRFDHKGKFGHALLVAGSLGKMGAAVLSARAALRSGVGLTTVHVPQCGYEIIQSSVPEAMALVDAAAQYVSEVAHIVDHFTAIGIGPGLGTESATASTLWKLLRSFSKPVVLDADALNLLAQQPEHWPDVPPGSILTPHPKEFQRLAGDWRDDFERLTLQREMAVSKKVVVVLKGAYTSVALPSGDVFFNSTGNPGMAKGGSGDVLTGMVTALLAQGFTPEDAARAGVFLHGLAGDLAEKALGPDGMTASDIIERIPAAFSQVFKNSGQFS
jgi:hydroxyethylthiazole kinase-like uncharacterized protein yjeF